MLRDMGVVSNASFDTYEQEERNEAAASAPQRPQTSSTPTVSSPAPTAAAPSGRSGTGGGGGGDGDHSHYHHRDSEDDLHEAMAAGEGFLLGDGDHDDAGDTPDKGKDGKKKKGFLKGFRSKMRRKKKEETSDFATLG